MAPSEIRFERNPDFIFRKVIDEFILVPVYQDVADMDCIYTLNDLGAFIWEKLDKQATQAQLEQAVMDEFDADPQVLSTDLEGFLSEMTSIGALRKVS